MLHNRSQKNFRGLFWKWQQGSLESQQYSWNAKKWKEKLALRLGRAFLWVSFNNHVYWKETRMETKNRTKLAKESISNVSATKAVVLHYLLMLGTFHDCWKLRCKQMIVSTILNQSCIDQDCSESFHMINAFRHIRKKTKARAQVVETARIKPIISMANLSVWVEIYFTYVNFCDTYWYTVLRQIPTDFMQYISRPELWYPCSADYHYFVICYLPWSQRHSRFETTMFCICVQRAAYTSAAWGNID